MAKITWSDFPLPLIQVNPPKLGATNKIIKLAYSRGVFSNTAEIQRKASSKLAQHVRHDLDGYLSCSNTSALTACLISIGVRGRHVLISNFTFAATLDAVILAGGIPVVCDIEQESLTLDINIVATVLRDGDYDIAAVVPTRVFGMMTDLSDLITLCDGKNIPVVVDAAASFPSRANLWNFSRSAHYEVFSLHATKVFGIGEGGLVIGNSESIDKLRQISNFGLTTDGSLKFTDGLNAKADEFTSARALARLQDYSNDVAKRHDFIKLYKNVFNLDSRIRMMHDNPETIYSYFPIIFESEELLLSFRTAISPFIMSRRYYFPTIKTGYIGNASIVFNSKLTFSESLAKRILCLPVYASYTKEVKLEIQNLLKKTMEKIN